MTGRGSIRHNNRSFSAANVDRSRSGQNVTFCNEDLKKVYHELFDEALADYNAKKKKTRDKIPDYYEHIRQSKQEKLFHEAVFQIGNLTDCGCGSPEGERAAAALKECALPGFVDSKNEEKTERNAGYLVVSHSGGGMLRQGTRKGIRRTPANRGMRAHRIVKSLDISEDVCHGLCP